MKKISHDDYVNRLKTNNIKVTVLEKYSGAHTKILHKCTVCGYEWKTDPSHILHGCPYCNKVLNMRLKFAKTTDDFRRDVENVAGNNFNVVGEYVNQETDIEILCNKCNNTFNRRPVNFLVTPKCPICNGLECVTGYNDIATTNPDIASLLKNKDIALHRTIRNKASIEKHVFICPDCGMEVTTTFYLLKKYGLKCPYCSDNISFPNKFITNMLMQLHKDFTREKRFSWSKKRIYDVYIENIKCIIEMHGVQHYKHDGFNKISDASLEKQKVNDIFKRELALSHGINNYFEIDCSDTSKDYIRQSIVKSGLLKLLEITEEGIDWDKCYYESMKSIVIYVCKDFSHGNVGITELADKYKISTCTTREYLLIGNSLKLCEYSPIIGNNQTTYKTCV